MSLGPVKHCRIILSSPLKHKQHNIETLISSIRAEDMGTMQEDESRLLNLLSQRQSMDEESQEITSQYPRNSLSYFSSAYVDEVQVKEPERSVGSKSAVYKSLRGIGLMTLAQVFSAMMNITVRMLENTSSQMQPQQILFFRMSITTVAITAYIWRTEAPEFLLGRKENRKLLMVRGIGGSFGVFGLYYSLKYLNLGEATVITFLAPLLANFMSAILLKTPLSHAEQAAGVISLFGVILVAKPASFLIRAQDATETAAKVVLSRRLEFGLGDTPPVQRLIALLAALGGALSSATAFTSMRWMAKPQSPLVAVNYFTACCTVMSLLSLIISVISKPRSFHAPENIAEWSMLVFSGVCGFIMQILITLALQEQDSSRTTNMVYTQIVFALILDALVFHVIPDFSSLAGFVLVLGSTLYQILV